MKLTRTFETKRSWLCRKYVTKTNNKNINKNKRKQKMRQKWTMHVFIAKEKHVESKLRGDFFNSFNMSNAF